MPKKFLPDEVLRDFTCINEEYIKKHGVRGILADLDDTFAEHNEPLPHPEFENWLSEMRALGIRLCILSNNGTGRTGSFAERYDLPFIPNAYKPRTYYYKKAVEVLHLSMEECVFVGDQLFTDIRGAKKSGLYALQVAPLGNRSNLFIQLKRKLEEFYG